MNTLRSLVLLLLCVGQAGLAPAVAAHGSVTAEGDLCVIRIGFYSAHFKVFQPQTSRQQEFCEDLPDAGESVFVMEYLHQLLGEVPIEFRIVRDVTGLGRYARLEDLDGVDLDAITVFHQPPVIAPQVFTVLHEFAEEGAFLGLVTVRNPDTGQTWAALFPFRVGFRGWGLLPLFLALGVLAQLLYWLSTGGYARWRKARPRAASGPEAGQARILMLVPLLLLLGVSPEAGAQASWTSESGRLQVSFASAVQPLPLNQIHQWTLQLQTVSGEPVENAAITVTGGMPAHNHGLPTSPVVTETGGGQYLLEGIRFHMQGEWVLTLTISHAATRDTILIPLRL